MSGYEEDIRQAYIRAMQDTGGITTDEISDSTRSPHIIDYKALLGMIKGFKEHYPLAEKDKYKHALLNCIAAQNGVGGALISSYLSGLRELSDVTLGRNTKEASDEDQVANDIGRLVGFKYPKGDCDELVRRYIKK